MVSLEPPHPGFLFGAFGHMDLPPLLQRAGRSRADSPPQGASSPGHALSPLRLFMTLITTAVTHAVVRLVDRQPPTGISVRERESVRAWRTVRAPPAVPGTKPPTPVGRNSHEAPWSPDDLVSYKYTRLKNEIPFT